MKKIITYLFIVLAYSTLLAQVPVNDVCNGTISLPPIAAIPLCTNTTQAPIVSPWTTTVSGTNINSNPAQSTAATCPPPDAPNDVWYSIVLKGTSMEIRISNVSGFTRTRINIWSSPTNGGCNASDFALNSCFEINGGNGTINVNNAMVEGTTYYIQVSGDNGAEFGTFDISVRGTRTCGACIKQANLTATPAPVAGYYLPGQTVKFRLTVTNYVQISTNWIHGIALQNIGNGWVPNSFTPLTIPASCDGNGKWGWYNSVTSTNTGATYGPGFFYDKGNDNNPGNNYGDNCTSHTWVFEWTLKVRACPFTPNINSLTFGVNTLGDGESGGWDNNDCYNDPDYTFQAYYQPFPPPTLTSTVAGCTPTGSITAVINGGTPNYSYQWSNGTSGTTNGTTPLQITGINAGVYTLKLTDANGCVSNSNIRVNANTTLPVANAGTNKVLSCSVPTAVIGAANVNGYSYSWNPTNNLNNSSIAQPTVSSAGTYTLTVTNNINGCTATDVVTITSTGTPPTANAGANKTLTCANPTTVIGTAGTAGNTYAWSPTNGLSNAGIAQPIASQAGTFVLTVTNTANGCTATSSVTVTENKAAPTANAGANKTLTCTNPTAVIGTAGTAGNTYAWLPTNGLSNAGIAQPIASQAGTFVLTVTNPTNGCSATSAVTVSVNKTNPTANAGSNKILTCTNPTAVIGTAGTVGNTYSWSPTTGLSNAGIAQPIASQAGTFILTVTNTANGCTATSTVTVTENKTAPTANTGANKTLTCTNPTAVIGTAGTAGNTYAWSPTTGLSNAGIAQPIASQAGTFVLTVTNPTNGCSATSAVTVSVNKTAPIANAGRDTTLTCTTLSTIIGTPAIAGNTYSWTASNGSTVPAIAQPTVSQAGTYTLTVTNTANGCTATDRVVIAQNITPPTANAGRDTTLTCTTTSVIIGTAGAGNTYAWTASNGSTIPAIARPTISQAGTYTVTVTKNSNGCTASDQVIITESKTIPTANAGTNKTLTCTNPTAVIGMTTVTGNTYTWSPTTGLSNAGISNPTVSQSGTYTLTVKNTVNGCSATSAVTISVNKTAPIANAGRDTTLTCTTLSAIIGTPAIAGNTYAWTASNGSTVPAIAQPTVSQAGTYTLTVTNTANGCTATDRVVIAQNITPPTANAGRDTTLTCTTTSVIIGTAGAGNTYAWTASNGSTIPAIARPTISQAGTYTVIVTKNSNGCTASDQIIIIENKTIPTANAGTNKTLTCTNPTAVIGMTTVAGNTYSWSPTTGLSNAGISNPTVSQAGTYTLTVKNTVNGCSATSAVTITVNKTAPIANAGRDTTLTCTTLSAIIGTPAIAGNTYAWTASNGSTVPAIAQPTVSQAGTYTLTVTNTANGCTATDRVVIAQNITPPTANAGRDTTLTCTTTSVVIGTTGTIGNTYAWTASNGSTIPAIAQPTISQVGTYTIIVTKNTNGCTATDQVVITENKVAPTANAGRDSTLTCTTLSTFIGTAALAGNTYTWTASNGLSIPSIARPTISQAGTYTVTVTNTANGCTANDIVVISQNIIPPTANVGSDKTLTCANPTAVIGTAGTASNTYSWSPTNGLSNAGIAQPTASQAGTFVLTVTNTTNGCTATSSVIISSDPALPIANAGANKVLTCANPTVVIGTAGTSGNTYTWSPTNGLSNAGIAQSTASQVGTFVLTVTNTSNGCTATSSVTVTENKTAPTANAGNDKILNCSIKNTTIGTSGNPNNSYQWNSDNNLSIPATAQVNVNKPGNYYLTVTSNANGCIASDTVFVNIDTLLPIADAGIDQQFGCPHTPLILGTSNLSNMTYKWQGIGLSDVNIANPTTDTFSTYILQVTNTINGCKSKPDTVITLDKNCDCEFFMPTAFSPNGDGINDILYAFKDCDDYRNFSLSIFNRWGELVYEANDITNGWDGFYKAELQPMDSYVWVINYFDVLYNKARMSKGIITILK